MASRKARTANEEILKRFLKQPAVEAMSKNRRMPKLGAGAFVYCIKNILLNDFSKLKCKSLD